MDWFFLANGLLFAVALSSSFGLFGADDPEIASDTESDDPDGYDPDLYSDEFYGTEHNDILSDTAANLAFFLNGGDDQLDASDDDDYADGGDGDDDLMMRPGDDIAYGGSGNDTIDGGTGHDILHGGDDDDYMTGNLGDDDMFGDAGDDTVYGGTGNDLIDGGTGNDVLSGMAQQATSDTATTADGVDTLLGGEGDDTLVLGPGDVGYGGLGADTFQIDDTRDDIAGVPTIEDYSSDDDALEIHYTPELDSFGEPIEPVVEVSAFDDNSASGIYFDGTLVATVRGDHEALTTEAIRLVAV